MLLDACRRNVVAGRSALDESAETVMSRSFHEEILRKRGCVVLAGTSYGGSSYMTS